jgi:hypothetical protein
MKYLVDSAGRSFSNQADYLLLTKASVEFLAKQTGLDYQIVLQRFFTHPNDIIT